jgi:hypothetical protein
MNKKILLTLIISIITYAANAEYLATFPLEANNGGTLPNGSINIVKNEAHEPTEERCQYVYSDTLSGTSAWAYRTAGARTTLRWNKEEVLPLSINIPDEITINGYKYSKGALQTQSGGYTLYTICRDKI